MGNLLNLMKMNAESSAMDTDPEFENFKNKANSSRELSYLESQYGDFLDPDRADTESFVMGSSNKDYIFGDEYLDGIKDLNEYRAQQQSGFNKTMSGLGRVGVKVAAEVAKMPGMIGGLVGGLITAPFSEEPLIETIFNNAWIRTIEDANQYINNEALPVYVKNSVKNGNLIDNLTSIDFWATEGADGVGYIASMFVPGAVLKSLGLGKIMMKGASKGAKGMYKSAEAAQDALESIKATDKGMDVFNATVANTFFEAGAESGGAMRAFESKKENFINKQLEKGLTEEEAEQFFIESKADLGRNIFWSNVAILVGPNAISNKILFGAKRGSKVASDYIDDAGKILTDPKSIFTAKNIAGYGKELVKGGAREGFWEEAMQSSVEHMYMNEAEDNENASITGVVNSYIHTLTTVDGQKAIALGALLGGPMNAYSKYSNDKVSEKRRQKLAPAMEKALGLFNLDPSKLFTINEETGKREINQEFAVKYGEEVKKLEAMSQLYDKIEAVKEENNGVLPQKDKAVAKANINNFISAFLLPFITNGEMGVEILEKSLKQNEDLIDKVNAQNKAFGENENRESYTAKIVEQAKNMQKDYEKSTEYLKYFTPIETSSENKEDLNEFYKEMNMLETFAKQNKRFLEKNKSKAETEFAELEIEALKNYQLKTETSKTQYKNISKFSNVKTKEGGALNISNIPSISFEEFQNKKDGFNSKDSFLEWYQNQPKSKLYNSKKNEILSAATAILNEESTIETLYDEKLLKQYFEQTLKEKKDKAEKIKELEKTIAEEEKKKNEEAEEEIIKKDNKAKKTREQKNANKKRTKLVNKVNNNNLLLDTLLTELDKQGKDVIIEPLTQDLIDIISQTNLDIEGLKIGNQIKYNKAVNNTINFEVLDVEIIDENDRTVSRIELSRQEVPKEKKPPVEDDTTHTTNDEQEEVDNVEEEEEKSDLEKINKAEQKELEINLIGEEVLVGNLINRPPTKGTIKEIKIINKPGFKPQLGFFSSEIGNVFFNDINKTSKLYSVVKEIKAKYQAQRDALNNTTLELDKINEAEKEELNYANNSNRQEELKKGRENTKEIFKVLKEKFKNNSLTGKVLRLLEKLLDLSKYSISRVENLQSDRGGGKVNGKAYEGGIDLDSDIYDRILEGDAVAVKTLIHELFHQVLNTKEYKAYKRGDKSNLSKIQKTAWENLDRLFNKALSLTTDKNQYGFTNLSEFLAEAFSDIGLQQDLSKMQGEGKKTSLFKNILDNLITLFQESINIWSTKFNKPTVKLENGLLEDVMYWSEQLIDIDTKISDDVTIKEIKAKYQAQRDALNSFSQQPTNKENKNEFFEKEKNNVTKTGLFMVSIASSRGKYEKIEKTVSDPNEVDVLNTKNENGITNYPDSNAKNSINAKNEILNVKVSLKKDKSTNELVLSGHIKAQFPKTTESSRDQAVGIALPIGNSTLNEKQLLTFYEKALIKILKSYLNSSTTNEMYNGEKIYTDRAEIARQLKKEWDIAMELSKSKEKLNSNSSNEFTNSDNISTGTFINEEISNEVNNLPENKQKEEDRTDAKVVDLKGSLSSNSEFFEYTEKQKNKLGEKVSFELGNPQSNKLASDALLKFKKILKNEERTELTEEEIEEFANYLPIKVLTKNGGYSHLSFLNKKNDERGNINVYKTTYELKKGIILEILKGNKPTSTIKFQMPGKIQMDRVNGKPAVNKIYDENGKANVFGIESLNNVQVLFSDSQGTLRNSNHDQVDSFNSVKHAGQVYISIKMANGRTIPLKLNQRRINNLEAEIIYKIVEAMTGSSIKLSYKDNLDMLMESVIFTKEERDYVFNELKALNKKSKNTNIISFFSNFVYKGNTDKNAFSIEGSSLRMKDQLIPFSELAGAKKEIIEWLTTEKNRQINKQASNTTAYKKHLFNSIISTDVKLGQPVFQGSTAIYLDPSMGNNPIDIKPNKKKTEPVVKKEPTKKTTIKAIKDKKKQNPENSQYSKEEQEYLNNVEDYRNRKIKDSNKQVLEETNTITYEKAEFLDNLYDVIPVNNKTEAKKAKKANKNSPTLEHIIKPVVVNKSTRSKSKYANMMKKANAKKNEDNDLNEGCNK